MSPLARLRTEVEHAVRKYLPGDLPHHVTIHFHDHERITIPMLAPRGFGANCMLEDDGPAAEPEDPEGEPAVSLEDLTDLQRRTLAVLVEVGKPIGLEALAAKMDYDRSNLHRRALKVLLDCGLIENHDRAGYAITARGKAVNSQR